ncbi:MAG: hypothetical protein OEM59_17725 [Rhodospirillales bacterium]|nr:hypothetical protein [Rhodospirillales bacterium]
MTAPTPAPTPVQPPAETIYDLRTRALTQSPEALGIAPSTTHPTVWGVLMETGYPEGLATLQVLADGTASLHWGSGGGIVGDSRRLAVREAAQAFLSAAQDHAAEAAPAEDHPLPEVGRVRFHLLAFDGPRGAEGGEAELSDGRHPFSGLFYAGHGVITQLIELAEAEEAA